METKKIKNMPAEIARHCDTDLSGEAISFNMNFRLLRHSIPRNDDNLMPLNSLMI